MNAEGHQLDVNVEGAHALSEITSSTGQCVYGLQVHNYSNFAGLLTAQVATANYRRLVVTTGQKIESVNVN